MDKPELLSPVGGKPHLIAAVSNGADAVYMGGMAFNARIFADNFSDEELPEAISYAHAHGVKVYMTINTLISDNELARAFEYCNYIYGAGADGVIIQDLGLARLLRKYLPDLPLHLYPWKALPVRNSAGCPWGKCLFCYHCFPKNKYYEKDTARTAEEMKAVADANNFRKLSLADFSVSPQALLGIAKNLIRIKANVKWDALTRADMAYSDKFAKVLAASGCRQLFVGLEIEDAEEIEKLNKGIKTSNFEKMLESCINNGISIGVFLLNYPGLSEEKLKTGLEYCRNLQKKSRGQMYLIVKDFELGRASNTIGHLDAFGIVLDKDVNMDVRSFSLPFKTTIPWKKLYD